MKLRIFVVLGFAVLSCANAFEPTPQGSLETLSSTRGRVVLNGLWKFQPAIGPAGKNPTSDWGLIPVPGSWQRSGWAHGLASLEGVVASGTGESWKTPLKTLSRAWYEREVEIPAAWQGRRVVLDLRRVSTDATVFVNGKTAGVINWPGGQLDITALVEAGQKAVLRLLVVATADEGKMLVLMGDAKGQNTTATSVLLSSGLVGEVFLESRPAGATISDVFVQPSVRENRLVLDVELSGVKVPGEVSFTARMLDEAGTSEKEFTGSAVITPAQAAAGIATVRLEWPWANARLWDLDQPNLYTLQLAAKGPGLTDEYPQLFGFREFWIEGRNFVLNGKPFRLRPITPDETYHVEAMEGLIRGMKKSGFNISQQWPENHNRRGSPYAHRELFYEVASRQGWPTIGAAMSMSPFLNDSKYAPIWNEPGVKERYKKTMEAELRRVRNFPAVLLWGTTANFFNQGQDQNPQFIGKRDYVPAGEEHRMRKAGDEALAMIRKADPTRPVFTHAGNRVGDVFTVNTYLNHIPLQEREEWLSEWAKNGEMPYIAIEFGNPLFADVLRGRNGFSGAATSEPLLTEFAAISRGRAAYADESSPYRRAIKSKHNGGQKWSSWHGGDSPVYWDPNFQIFQSDLMLKTWRAWRAAGITGGMVPWNLLDNSLYRMKSLEPETAADPKPGQRGAWLSVRPTPLIRAFQTEGGWLAKEAAESLLQTNGETLAFIAGPAERFTAKDHNFRPGETVHKQIALINDAREAREFSGTWKAVVAGVEVGSGEIAGKLEPAETRFLPVEFPLPAQAAERESGTISLAVKIGSQEHADAFAFRIFPSVPRPALPQGVLVFDPAGDTSAWLKSLGIATAAWDGQPSSDLLVVGRRALSGGTKSPGDLEAYARAGGRILLMAPDPDFAREQLGLRISRNVSRQVFPADEKHPVLAGLEAEDLRDWRGEGTLLEPYPDYPPEQKDKPYSGWRWGNYGSVASAAWEKPHASGWRPILEGEFDLAYSPLMELDLGRGRVTFCGLDLEARQGASDPVAERLALQILHHAAKAPLAPRLESVVYLGGAEGTKFLDGIGLNFTKATALPKPPALAVIAPDASVTETQFDAFLNAGGRAFILPQTQPGSFLGAEVEKRPNFRGSLDVATAREFAGLSPSDLRTRTEREALVLTAGPEIVSDGLFGIRRAGPGVAVFTQLDPSALDADKNTFLRFTRWRQTRAISQVLANLGASFRADARIFRPERKQIPLAGTWKYQVTKSLPSSPSPEALTSDPGPSPDALALLAAEADTSAMKPLPVPGMIPEFEAADGEAVLRTEVELPANWAGNFLILNLGPIDDYDEVWFNGTKVGSTGVSQKDAWNHPRRYRIPGSLVKEGRNTVAVRVFDAYSRSGLLAVPDDLNLRLLENRKDVADLYHPDYREDFELGDEPYRYYRW
jgi:beta-galactosidase